MKLKIKDETLLVQCSVSMLFINLFYGPIILYIDLILRRKYITSYYIHLVIILTLKINTIYNLKNMSNVLNLRIIN